MTSIFRLTRCLRPRSVAALFAMCGSATAFGQVQISEASIGQTDQSRSIMVYRIASAPKDAQMRDPDSRPGVAIIAGLHAAHWVGIEVAERLPQLLMREHAELFEGRVVYVLPVGNPDGVAIARDGGNATSDWGRSPKSMDADRDGRLDEDPAEDLNGDGMITMMRVLSPAPATGLTATHVIDSDDDRIVREPKADENEYATHAVLIEGIDNDGDGTYNEDGWAGDAGGGVHLDRNFPTLWAEHDEDAGLYPFSAPESKAIGEWLQGRPNIQAVIVYGPGSTVRHKPAIGVFEQSGQVPKGIEKDDEAHFNLYKEAFLEGLPAWDAPKHASEGSLATWAYSDLGVWSFQTSVWGRPNGTEDVAAAAGDDSDDGEKTADGGEADTSPDDERATMLAQGVPAQIVTFLLATPDEREAMMASMESLPAEERAAMMASVEGLPPMIRDRVMALAQGLPDPAVAEDGPADTEENAASMRGKKTSKATSEDEKWLAYFDEAVEGDPDNAGFVAWVPFDHPELGPVEIGGFVPGARMNPASDKLESLATDHAAAIARVASRLPDLRLGSPVVERISDGLFRVTLSVTNSGVAPTQTAIGRKVRRVPPTVVELSLDPDRFVSGGRMQRLDSIAGGDTAYVEWLVAPGDARSAEIVLRSARFGDRTVKINFGG